jgi:hypothetical protein
MKTNSIHHIIIDELHLLLRICDKLLKNLILDTKTLDDKNAVHSEKSDFLGQLTEKIRGCGVSFYIWTKKGTQGEINDYVFRLLLLREAFFVIYF